MYFLEEHKEYALVLTKDNIEPKENTNEKKIHEILKKSNSIEEEELSKKSLSALNPLLSIKSLFSIIYKIILSTIEL